jgi:hypothetical protein
MTDVKLLHNIKLYLSLELPAERIDRLVDLLKEFGHCADGFVFGLTLFEVLHQAILCDLDTGLDLRHTAHGMASKQRKHRETHATRKNTTKKKNRPCEAIGATLTINIKELGRLLGVIPRPRIAIQYNLLAQHRDSLGGQ